MGLFFWYIISHEFSVAVYVGDFFAGSLPWEFVTLAVYKKVKLLNRISKMVKINL
jgi:hypothetical protein